MQAQEIVAYRKDMEWEEYLVPGSLDEALEMLERYRGAARVIAGGTDIVPATRKGAPGIKALVDITRIPGLNTISTGRRDREDRLRWSPTPRWRSPRSSGSGAWPWPKAPRGSARPRSGISPRWRATSSTPSRAPTP